MKKTTLLLILFGICSQVWSQKPAKLTASEIYHEIQKLNFLGSVLYVAAHPDDENTRLISYMANHQKARTAYLSLTRGDGGQNLIGPELRELLGVIRTQELIEARKIDGGEQLFTRANDFGFSKVPAETLRIWDKDQVMEDMIFLVRKFRPDIIINRFDHRSPGTTHGHHTSSAMLSLDIFEQTADPTIYPEQLKTVSLWQPKRLFFNTSWWFYGGREQFNKADKSQLVNFETGAYYPLFGKSNQEIASLSRSQHQSQGFGSTGSRGEDIEYLELIKGEMPSDKKNLFEGIDTSWKRIKDGAAIGKILEGVEKNYNFTNPSASLPELMKAFQRIQQLEDTHWREVKTNEIKKIIYACAGLFLEGVADRQHFTPGATLPLRIEAINRSPVSINLRSITLLPSHEKHPQQITLQNNSSENIEINYILPKNLHYTHPYWLEKEGTLGMYRVDEQQLIGLPDIQREVKLSFELEILGIPITYEKEVIYKYNDPVKGEVYRPLDIVPEVSLRYQDKVVIFRKNQPQSITVVVKAGRNNVEGSLVLQTPKNWKVTPSTLPFSLEKMNMETSLTFTVTAEETAEETQVGLKAVVNNTTFQREQILLEYDHIARQQVLIAASAKWIPLEIKTFGENIAYIMGAGDEVPQYLSQMGYNVTLVKPEHITAENLKPFQVIMMGIRAYKTVEELAFKQKILLEHVEQGATMIVQYNTAGKLVTPNMAPYRLKISRDRVTEEDAPVHFLAPEHQVLNYPNTITAADFTGWVQEQGLYYPNEWDPAFTPILSSQDEGETPKKGALLVAPYGKGYYIYTGLSFFRELPAGVTGAYRLLANMISINSDAYEQGK